MLSLNNIVQGWKYTPSKAPGQPVVSMVHLDKECFNVGVSNDFISNYKEYYSKVRGFMSLNRTIVFGPFDTFEEARKIKTSKISYFNLRFSPLVVDDYYTKCN